MRRTLLVLTGALTILTLSACGAAERGPGSASATGGRSATPITSPTPGASSGDGSTGGGAAYCPEVNARAAKMSLLLGRTVVPSAKPADVMAAYDEIGQNLRALAAVAPRELQGDYRVLLDGWQRDRDVVEKAGWSPATAKKQVNAQFGDQQHLDAVGHIAAYVDSHCHGT